MSDQRGEESVMERARGQGKRKSGSKRFPLRLVPEDRETLDRTMTLTEFGTKAELVRAALGLLRTVWDAKAPNNRIVLRHEELGRQYGVLVPRATRESLDQDDIFAESKTATKEDSFEIRLSRADESALDWLIEYGAAATRSQAIRRALALYAHVAPRIREGYRLASLTPSGEPTYLGVPGIRLRPAAAEHKPLVFVFDDDDLSRKLWVTALRTEGAETHAPDYDLNKSLEENLKHFLEAGGETAEGAKPAKIAFVVDLCWALRKDRLGKEDHDLWGIIENDDGQPVAGYAGFMLIEAASRYSWAKDVRFTLVSRLLGKMVTRQQMASRNFARRRDTFKENVAEAGLRVLDTFWGETIDHTAMAAKILHGVTHED